MSPGVCTYIPSSPLLYEWRAELDAPVISAAIVRVRGEYAVLVLTTQAKSLVSYAITSKGISGSRSVWSLAGISPGETLTSICTLDEKVFLASISAIYELRVGTHKTQNLTKIYYAQNTPWPLRNLSATRCGGLDVLVTSFGLPMEDPDNAGLLVVCLRNGLANVTVLPTSIGDSASPSLQYDPASSLLHVLVSTTNSGVVLFCVCFEEPSTLNSALRGSEWFTQTGTEFYTSRLIVFSLGEHFSHYLKDKSELTELQVRAVCMCGASAIVTVSAICKTGQRLDVPVLLVISELLSCLSFSTIELDSLGCQCPSSGFGSDSFNICSLAPSSVIQGGLCLACRKGSRFCVYRIPIESNSSADSLLSTDICELAPSAHTFCAFYEMDEQLRCVFTSVDGWHLALCMANTDPDSSRRVRAKEEPKKEQGGKQKRHKIRISTA